MDTNLLIKNNAVRVLNYGRWVKVVPVRNSAFSVRVRYLFSFFSVLELITLESNPLSINHIARTISGKISGRFKIR
jgi:hypothetical protein